VETSRPSYHEFMAWKVYNADKWSADKNYSKIAYMQRNNTNAQQGEDGARAITVYSDRDCGTKHYSNGTPYPFYAWSCQSPANGSCLTVPYSVASFLVISATDVNRDHRCWDAAFRGVAASQTVSGLVFVLPLVLVGLLGGVF